MYAKVPIGTTSQWALLQSIPRPGPKLLLNAYELVILAGTLGTAYRACLYLSGIYGNGKVGNERVFCISATVGYDARVIVALCQCNSF